MSFLARQPVAGLLVRMILFRVFEAHWTNKSRENPHSKSGTLTNTAYKADIDKFMYLRTVYFTNQLNC